MATNAQNKNEEVSMLERLNRISDDIHGFNSNSQEEHRVQCNRATQELRAISNAHREGTHYLTKEENQIAQDAWNYYEEIKDRIRELTEEANKPEDQVIDGPIDPRFERGFKLAEILLRDMTPLLKSKQKVRQAIVNAGRELRPNPETGHMRKVDVVHKDHPRKKALWDLYYKTVFERTTEVVEELEAKVQEQTATEQEVLKLEIMKTALLNPRLQDID